MTASSHGGDKARLLRLAKRFPPRNIALLAGSGISVPSGLPSAFGIGAVLADFFAGSHKMADALKKHLTAVGKTSGIQVGLRFERLLQVVRDTVDRRLRILRCLDQSNTPTELHVFLARMMTHGASVFTTNFDCLIERAYLELLPTGQLTVLDREDTGPLWVSSFASVIRQRARPSKKRHFLFKLHGSLHGFVVSASGSGKIGRWRTNTVNATLDTIGRNSLSAQLEVNKEQVLRRELAGKLLVVLGYSGLDDFDIVPTLERILKAGAVRGVIWISHKERGRMSVRPWSSLRSPSIGLPGTLTQSIRASGRVAYVIRGATPKIIRCIFPGCVPPSVLSWPLLRFDPCSSMTREPYKSMNSANRRFAAGRLFEAAGDPFHADLNYRRAITYADRRRNRDAFRIKGLALSRRGYIWWRKGDNIRALTHMKRAFKCLTNARDSQGIAAVTSQIGLVCLNRGQLDEALDQFSTALKLFRRLRNRSSVAKVLTNIGIVHRRRDNYAKARSYYERALRISIKIRDRDGMARDLGNLSNIHLAQERYKLALRDAQRAFELAEQLGEKQIAAVQAGNIGICLRHLGRFPEALQAHRKALRLNERLGRAEGVHDAISETGSVLYSQKRFGLALKRLTQAILLAKKNEDLEGHALDLDHRGDVYEESGRMGKARKDWQQSARLFARLEAVSKFI